MLPALKKGLFSPFKFKIKLLETQILIFCPNLHVDCNFFHIFLNYTMQEPEPTSLLTLLLPGTWDRGGNFLLQVLLSDY